MLIDHDPIRALAVAGLVVIVANSPTVLTALTVVGPPT